MDYIRISITGSIIILTISIITKTGCVMNTKGVAIYYLNNVHAVELAFFLLLTTSSVIATSITKKHMLLGVPDISINWF